ncbi:transport and Golgi organization protein 1 homolog [Callospermophilus lateralis]|uniref:transport and Golgi organization protein 1 homolog n=1 Tax=Callospermophilus lateralis TaxID=76772 RepID=UPI0040548675
MAAAPGLLFWLFVLCPTWRVLGQPDPSTGRRFSKHKLCADDECSMLMYRGEALEDFRGPDCRFVNFKKGDPVYVYYKLAEVSPELWAGSVGRIFGYFPKDFIKVVREYTKEELQIPTDETDFVCFDGGRDDFDNYNVEELLGFLELYDSANEDSEKAIEKVEQFPEVSQDVEPEPKPVVANSEQIESAFSENTMDLEEQFLAQKNHPHADSQTDNTQGEQTSFEPFEEILQDKLKVPESENNKTSNSSQVSNEQKTDAYKLLKKEMTLDLKTKFGSTADALVSDDETTRLVTSLEDDFDDEELDADYYAFDKEEEENKESFGELPLLTFISEDDMKFPVEFGVEKYSIGEEQNSNEEDKVEVTLPPGIKDDDKNILTTLEDTLFIGTGGDEKTDMMDLGNSYSEEEKEDEEALVPDRKQKKPQAATDYIYPESAEYGLFVETSKTDNDEEPKVDIELHIKGKETDVQEPKKHLMQDVSELEDEKIEEMIAYTSPQSNKLSSLPAVEKGKDTLKSAFENKENDLKEAVIHISKDSKEVNEELSSPGEKILEDSLENKSLHKAVGSLMTQEQSKPPESLGIATFLGDNQNDASKDGMGEPGSVNTPTLHIDSVEHQPQEIKEGLVLKTENQSGFSSPDGIGLLREPEEEVPSPRKNLSWQQERDVIVTVSQVNEKIGLSKDEGKEQSLAEELIQHKATQGTQEIKKTEQTDEVEVPGLHTERPAAVEEDYYPPEELLEDENAVSAKQSKEKHSGIQNVNQHVLEKAILETINPDLETKENKQEMSIIWEIFKKSETTAKRVDMMDKERGDMEMGKEESPLADEEAQGLFDGSDEENTQTSGISEVFQDKDSDDLEKDNPKEHLNTLGSTEKATGKEISKEDLEDIGHITDAESQGPASADLEDDIFPQSPHIALKPELSDQEEDLPIIRSFFTEQKSLQRFLKYFDVQELEAMLQEMSLKLKSAQQESLPYNLEKVLDKVFRASESHILSVAEQMLDNRVNDIRDIGIKESNIFEEAAVLDDIQDLIYFVRYKHSTVEETAPLITAPPLEEIWAKAEEMQPPHEDDFPKENTNDLNRDLDEEPRLLSHHFNVNHPEEPSLLSQPVTEDMGVSEVSQIPNTEKVGPELLITEGTPVDAADTENQPGRKVEEPADATLLDNMFFLLYSFLLNFTKMSAQRLRLMTRFTCVGRKAPAVEEDKVHSHYPPPALGPPEGSVAPLSCPYTMDSVPATVPSVTASPGDPELLGPLSVLYAALIAKLLELFTTLPDEYQPGPDFYGLPWEPVVFTVFFGFVSFAIFFWRTVLVVKDRVYQVTEQQISQKIINFMKENEELKEKFSKYEQKMKESKKQVQETMKQNMILSDEATKYKDKIKLLEKAKELLDEKAKSLHVMLESEREQKAKNHDLIMENKKSIEKLKDVIAVNTSELSELQVVLNEAKLREEKVKLEYCQLQKENTMLKKKKEQLQQEVKDWSTSHTELSEQIKSFEKSQKDLLVALNHKDDTINALTNYITQLNRLQCESESEDQNREDESDELTNGEVAGDRNEKIKDQIKQMMDVSRTQTTISVVEEDLKLLQLKLRASMSTKCNLEDQIKKLEGDYNSLQSSKVELEEECKTLRQKVEILNELYQKNEMALQKKLSQEECERLEKEQRLSAADEKMVSAVQEVKNYKRRIEEMEEELQKTEHSFKNQIAMHEKKAHDNWLKARSAERAIAEEKREAANLRQKLLEMTQKMAMRQDEPVIVKPMPGRPNLQNPPRRGPLSHNGSFGPSPVSGGECSPPLTAEPAGRPPSATLNQRDMPRNGFDPGCGPAHMNSSSRSSSPAKVTDEGKVNMAMKGPPRFSGVPFMGPPMGPPMGRPPPPPIWYGPPFQLGGPFGPRPIPPPFDPGMRPPIAFREYAPGVPPGKRDLPFDPRDFFPGPAPFRPLGSFGPREYFIPGDPLPPPTHGPQDYGPPPAAKDLMPSGFKDEPPPTPDSQSSEGCSQALKQGP